MQITQEIKDKLNMVRVLITLSPDENLTSEDILNGSFNLIRLGDLMDDILHLFNESTKCSIDEKEIQN